MHNLRRVEWNNPNGTEMTNKFNQYIIDAIKSGEKEKIINYKTGPEAAYAVPTPDHYLPLIYCLGSAENDEAEIFNNVCNLGRIRKLPNSKNAQC